MHESVYLLLSHSSRAHVKRITNVNWSELPDEISEEMETMVQTKTHNTDLVDVL
jgi:hypothetical protein